MTLTLAEAARVIDTLEQELVDHHLHPFGITKIVPLTELVVEEDKIHTRAIRVYSDQLNKGVLFHDDGVYETMNLAQRRAVLLKLRCGLFHPQMIKDLGIEKGNWPEAFEWESQRKAYRESETKTISLQAFGEINEAMHAVKRSMEDLERLFNVRQ